MLEKPRVLYICFNCSEIHSYYLTLRWESVCAGLDLQLQMILLATRRCCCSGPFTVSQAQHGDFKSGKSGAWLSPSWVKPQMHSTLQLPPLPIAGYSILLSVSDTPHCFCRSVIFVCVSVPVGSREPKIHVQCPLWSQAISQNLELIGRAAQLVRPGVFLSLLPSLSSPLQLPMEGLSSGLCTYSTNWTVSSALSPQLSL